MNSFRHPLCSALAILFAGLTVTLNPSVASGQQQSNTSTDRTAKEIDAIIYASSTRDEILAKLKPYAAPMQTMEDVRKKLDLGFCFGSGPGVMQCQVANTGLSLVFDPDKKLRLIRRDAQVVNGVSYPEMSITDRGFEWHGYRRLYEN
ncbi:hypothetical protein [Dyella mobilis]|uniref:Uncharacterized protein n=1 Tax=Dyella mobilis TaxID=1849582 RepID=A0ABS2KFN0_9GAMM|nr:hypothetical protein [Dyella mobilis]MBM7129567.1 hypothetical protein [Dyella mobilis]GLQ98168.1 hypothetical protein GCM10007863_25880 [Dyella mobilis]